MNTKIIIFIFLLTSILGNAQNFHLKIIGKSSTETKLIDSIGYESIFPNTKILINETNQLSTKLTEIGYLENKNEEIKAINDTTYQAQYSLGNQTKKIDIYIGIKYKPYINSKYPIKNDTLILPYPQIESFLKQTLQKLEQNGYSFAKIKLVNIRKHKEHLIADLKVKTGGERILNEIVIQYSNQKQKNLFPKGALKEINKKYNSKIFNQETINEIHTDFEKYNFINQVKFPEILFTKDTTKVFVYLEKKKSNTFDGYLGFNNTENKKIRFNGYLDITLENILKKGEQLSIYWKNDGNDQKTFNASLDLPYLFDSPIGLKALINIFKQDSIYQNTKTNINLGYLINYNKRIYLGYQSTESSDIQNINKIDLSDYENSFITSTIDFRKNDSNNSLFPLKNYLYLNLGLGKRTSFDTITTTPTKQFFANFNIMNNFYINEKNCINLKSENYYLKSNNYLINELFRFGGVNSVRGFSENSLQANFMTSIISEYRYLLSSKFYLNSILDYCLYKDPTSITNKNKLKKILGIGLGLGIQTSNGLLKFAVANGKSENQQIEFYNTIITISYNVKF
ncbi:BamA/TamA family outer membrane protein [Flavobacterium sp. N3904]|uniref:BamA/TamA family outer membrane protein n=1 Tax=Flavobacterium sp. N3904 TaxID=2986835 RepID=UPI002225B00C|nr:BamA/TamA family outer membrane protein [Flavobacterium sp. N3904]